MKTFYIIGLMSGTSLDGVDLIYVKFDVTKRYSYQVICVETIPYSIKWKNKLQEAFNFNANQLEKLSIDYGNLLSEIILDFIKKNQIKKVDFIASHGHTIHHRPEIGYTLQIGDGKTINEKTNIKTICDFRTQDVRLGGQGAPLVPIGDAFLFSDYDYCLNLGGFANISYNKRGKRLAFDICSVNIVLNHFSNLLGFDYDDKGKIAQSGKLDNGLLKALNDLEFYKSSKPKSLGIEFVHKEIFPLMDRFNLKPENVLRTYVEHIAMQIANNIHQKSTVLITGGGAFNSFLIKRIQFYNRSTFIIPDDTTINFKEALIFAFLGLRRLENKVNCLQSVTGAKEDHCSGEIFG